MSDIEYRDQAVAQLKKTTDRYAVFGVYWQNAKTLLDQISDANRALVDQAWAFLELTTRPYSYYLKRNIAPPANSNWGKALDLLARVTNPAPTPTPIPVTIAGSIVDGEQLAGSLVWSAVAGPDVMVASVDFLIDGTLRWTEHYAPFVYNGDPDGKLDTATLPNGGHSFTVKVTAADGRTAKQSVVATVANAVPVPPPPPAPGAVARRLKGICAYNTGDVAKIRSSTGAGSVRSDLGTLSDSFVAACDQAGLEILPAAVYARGFSSKGDHYYPDAGREGAWADSVVSTLARWPGHFRAVESWNEPWLLSFSLDGVDAPRFLNLTKILAGKLWAKWPETLVIVSLDYWVQGQGSGRIWQNEVLAADTDGWLVKNAARLRFSTHNYVESATPTTVRGFGWSFDRYAIAHDALVAHGVANPILWITEYGWESAKVGLSNQAAYIAQALAKMEAVGYIERAYLFYEKAGDTWTYNLWNPDGSLKPACDAVKSSPVPA